MLKRASVVLICAALVIAGFIGGIFITKLFMGRSGLSLQLDKIINAPLYKNATWGLLVVDMQSGKTLLDVNGDKRFCPASTTKLFAMATALNALGPDYRFKTPVYRRKGDLILVASGDFALGGRLAKDGQHYLYTRMDHTDAGMDGAMSAVLADADPLAGLNDLARQVAESGIKKVSGDILIDDTLFETSVVEGTLIRTPIMVNDNLIDLIITPAKEGDPAKVESRPMTASYSVEAAVMTAAAGTDVAIAVSSPAEGRILVSGTIPEGNPPSIRNYWIKDPAAFARSLFIEALQRAGINVVIPRKRSAQLPAQNEYAALQQVAAYTSPPFSEMVKVVLKVSHNPGADVSPLLVAARNGKRSYQDGMLLEKEFLNSAGVDVSSISISDGQGGDPADFITPRAVTALLTAMARRPDFNLYHDALPILGVDGSLTGMVAPDSPARGKVFAKTGTLMSIDRMNERFMLKSKGLGGYMTSAKGRQLVFSIYVNNVGLNSADEVFSVVGKDVAKVAEEIYKEY